MEDVGVDRHAPAGDARDLRLRVFCLLLAGALLSLAVVRYAGADAPPPIAARTH